MADTIDQLEIEDETVMDGDELLNQVIITLDGRDITIGFDQLGVNMDSTERQILEAVGGIIEEAEGTREGYDGAYNGDYTYTVRKSLNSNRILVYPKPVAG